MTFLQKIDVKRVANLIRRMTEEELAELIEELDENKVRELHEKTAGVAAGSYQPTSTTICGGCGRPM